LTFLTVLIAAAAALGLAGMIATLVIIARLARGTWGDLTDQQRSVVRPILTVYVITVVACATAGAAIGGAAVYVVIALGSVIIAASFLSGRIIKRGGHRRK